jgi:hypothetical protein
VLSLVPARRHSQKVPVLIGAVYYLSHVPDKWMFEFPQHLEAGDATFGD